MEKKKLIWIGMTIGTAIGSYVPALWGAGMLSFSSVLLGGVGGILGIWLGAKFGY